MEGWLCQLMVYKVFNRIAFSLQAHMSNTKGGDKQYRHNQQLEELRNLQDKLSGEKASWATTKEQEEKELEEKRQELLRLQVSNLTLLKISIFCWKKMLNPQITDISGKQF